MNYLANNYYFLPKINVIGCLFLIAIATDNSYSAEQQLAWSMQNDFEHDDNFRLTNSNEQSLSGYSLGSNLDYMVSDEINQLSFKNSISLEKYNRSEYDFEGYSTNLGYSANMERNAILIDLDSTKLSTRTTENDDTGNIINQASYRMNTNGSLSWRYLVNETNDVLLSSSKQKTLYESDLFADYDIDNYSATWQYKQSQKTMWRLRTYYSEYEADFFQTIGTNIITNNTTSETTGLEITVERNFSYKLSLEASIGNADIKTDITQQNSTTNQIVNSNANADLVIYSAAINYALVSGNLLFSTSRNTQASGSGSLVEVDEASFTMVNNLSELDQIRTQLQYIKRSDIDNNLNSLSENSRDFYGVNAFYTRKITSKLSSTIGVGYRTQEFNDRNDNGEADAFSGTLSINYAPNRLIW